MESVGEKKRKRAASADAARWLKRGGYLLFHFRSTIGVAGFNFSVRNGKRWSPRAITTLVGCSDFRSLPPVSPGGRTFLTSFPGGGLSLGRRPVAVGLAVWLEKERKLKEALTLPCKSLLFRKGECFVMRSPGRGTLSRRAVAAFLRSARPCDSLSTFCLCLVFGIAPGKGSGD